MPTKIVLSILCVALCQQHLCTPASAMPAANVSQVAHAALLNSTDLCLQKIKYEELDSSEEDSSLSASDQLLKLGLQSFQLLSLNYAQQAKNISEQLLVDSELLGRHTATIEQFRANITQFQKKYAECGDIEQLFDLVEFYSNTTSFYYDLDETNVTMESKLISNALRKYGSKDLDDEFQKLFNVFVEDFTKKFDELQERLKHNDAKNGKKILEWYDEFKTLKEYDDKINAFETFFKFFEDDSKGNGSKDSN